ncbi:MAG: hypothetical protein FJ279_01915, partial [Planctomycetes bacterium]|nr:hypothetical protein [Planctomycetota bacterium]
RTLPYVAPEVLRASSTVDQRADLYGLGATLYHMLAGTAPWAGRRVSDAAPPKGAKSVRASRDELAPPSKLNPSVTEPLSALVMKCLERDASRRFQSAREFLAALKAVAGSSG